MQYYDFGLIILSFAALNFYATCCILEIVDLNWALLLPVVSPT